MLTAVDHHHAQAYDDKANRPDMFARNEFEDNGSDILYGSGQGSARSGLSVNLTETSLDSIAAIKKCKNREAAIRSR